MGEKIYKPDLIVSIVVFLTHLFIGTATSLFFNWLFHNPWCNFMFKCGCTWNFAGGWDKCNIHDPNAAYKCPLCSASPQVAWTSDWMVIAFMLFSYLLVIYGFPFAYNNIQKRRHKPTPENEEEAPAPKDIAVGISYQQFYFNRCSPSERPSLKESFSFAGLGIMIGLVAELVTFVLTLTIVSFVIYLASDYPEFIF